MSEIMLLSNPRRRRTSRKKTATRKRRRNPVATNPRRRRKVSRKRRRNPVAANPRRRSVRRRRNPTAARAFSMRNIQGQLRTAGTGALGALGLDVALAYLPLPAQLKTGMIGKLAKGAGAIALGVVANRFLKVSATNANRMTEGALTVQLHGIGRELLTQFAPAVALSAYLNDEQDSLGYAGSGWNPSHSLSWGDENGLNAYLTPAFAQESAAQANFDSSGY